MTVRADFVFADDIRSENNGKLILIGVYADGLVPGALPATFNMSVWARLRGLPAGDYSITATAKFDNATLLSFDLAATVDKPDRVVQVILTGMPVKVQAPGMLSLTLSTEAMGEIATGFLPIEDPKPIPGAPQVVQSTPA